MLIQRVRTYRTWKPSESVDLRTIERLILYRVESEVRKEKVREKEKERERYVFLAAVCEMLFASRFKAMANFQTAGKRFCKKNC